MVTNIQPLQGYIAATTIHLKENLLIFCVLSIELTLNYVVQYVILIHIVIFQIFGKRYLDFIQEFI